MYITPKQKRRTMWVAAIVAIGIPLTVLAAITVTNLLSNAGGDETPRGVILSNVTTNSITLSWVTTADSTSSVSVDGGIPFVDIRGVSRRKTHYVEVTDLNPASAYSFSIKSNDKDFTNESGNAFRFTTADVTGTTPVPNPTYGTVKEVSADDSIVYITMDNTFPASAAVTVGGNWIIDLSGLTKTDDSKPSIDATSQIKIIARTEDSVGVVLSGTYADLFDNDGKLLESVDLTPAANSVLLSGVPSFAQVSVVDPKVVAEEPEPTVEPEVPDEGVGGADVTVEEPEKVVGYRYVMDIDWTAVSGSTITGASIPDVTVGEEAVQITNTTDTSFTVVWLTSKEEVGEVRYGTTSTALDLSANDERDSILSKGEYSAHSIVISKLQPETKYYFKILTGDIEYDNSGDFYAVDTFQTLSSPPEFKTITGKVDNFTGGDGVVIASIADGDGSGSTGSSTKFSTLVDADGNWIVTVGDARAADGSAYYNFTDGDTLSASLTGLVESTSVSEVTAGIEDKSLVIETEAIDEGRSFASIPLLEDYGVYGYAGVGGVGGTVVSNSGEDEDNPEGVGGVVPNTALPTGLYATIAGGIVAIGAGVYMFTRDKGSKVQKKSMKDRYF